MKSHLLPWLLAALGGALWGLCFGVETRLLLPWVALVPLLWLTAGAGGGRTTALQGWLHGIVHWVVAVPWIVHTLVTFGGLPRPLGWLLLLLMAAILGSFHGFFVVLGRRVARRDPWLALFALPALWVTVEWLRGRLPAAAFPWNLAGYAWTAVPGALPSSAWIGAYGLGYLLLFANAGSALAIRRRRPELAVVGLLLPLLILALGARFSWSDVERAGGGEVAVLQPGSAVQPVGAELWDDYRRLIELSTAACAGAETPGSRLLVWPESAAFPLAWQESARLRADVARLAATCPVLLNTPLRKDDGLYNGALLIDAGGVAGEYAKRRLVPFGEYVPLGELLPFVGTLARIAEPFRPGTEVGLVPWRDERLGLAVCYEVTFPEMVAEQVRAGASILVTITNDGWYGDTSAPWQHFRAARFRAAENRRPMIRAALTGVSGLIDARGRVVARLGVGERDVLEGRVRGAVGLSPYARAPWLVLLLCALVSAFAIIPRRRARDDTH